MSTASDELMEKRRDLLEGRRVLKTKLTALSRDLAAVDRVLQMLDPAYKPQAGHTNHRNSAGTDKPFKYGEITALALEALRKIGRPALSTECATAMLEQKGLSNDTTLYAQVASQVATVFSQKVASGQIRRVPNSDARHVLWEVAR
jgi:hypothetical protein